MGYTPIFASVFEGSLSGRWPHSGVWLCLLAMADRRGEIDVIPRRIAADLGIEEAELLRCIDDFCSPDPMSRSQEHEGRRLELIDPARPWGWRIVNHSKYREKARKAAHDAERVASGANRERMAQRRAPDEGDPTRPDATRADPLSDSDTDTNIRRNPPTPLSGGSPPEPVAKEAGARKVSKGKKPAKVAWPEGLALDQALREYAERHLPGVNAPELWEHFHGQATAKAWAYADWRAAWQTYVRNCRPDSGHFSAGNYPKLAGAAGRAPRREPTEAEVAQARAVAAEENRRTMQRLIAGVGR